MCGIAVACVEAVGRNGAHLLLQVCDLEGRSLIDRRGERTVLFGQAGAAAYRLGFLTELMLFHTRAPAHKPGISQHYPRHSAAARRKEVVGVCYIFYLATPMKKKKLKTAPRKAPRAKKGTGAARPASKVALQG